METVFRIWFVYIFTEWRYVNTVLFTHTYIHTYLQISLLFLSVYKHVISNNSYCLNMDILTDWNLECHFGSPNGDRKLPVSGPKWMKMHFMRYLQRFIDIECLQIFIKFMLQINVHMHVGLQVRMPYQRVPEKGIIWPDPMQKIECHTHAAF